MPFTVCAGRKNDVVNSTGQLLLFWCESESGGSVQRWRGEERNNLKSIGNYIGWF